MTENVLRAEFVPHTPMTWPEALHILAGADCTWTDLDGFHVGPPPDDVPITTHLWAWHTTRCFRARIDEHDVYLAELALTEHGTTRVHLRQALLRPETNTTALGETTTIEVLELPGQHPITFLRPAHS